MTDKIKATMFAESGVMLTPLNCPLCGGCDQHKPDCVLSGKEHVYVSVSQGLVDWPKTLELNNIEIVQSEPVLHWRDMSSATHPSSGDIVYIAALPKGSEEPVVVYWDSDQGGWWLPEGALYQDDYFVGWVPLPLTTFENR